MAPAARFLRGTGPGMSPSRSALLGAALLPLGAALLLLGAAPAAGSVPALAATGSGTVRTIAAGLDNPRSLAFGPDGHLYVTEAGHGGTDCPAGAMSPEGQPVCFGATGSLSRLSMGTVTRIATGFASVANPQGVGAEGLAGLTRAAGNWQVVMDLAPQLVTPGLTPADTRLALDQFGRLIAVTDGGRFGALANPGGADYTWSTTHHSYAPKDFPDANPFAVLYDGPRTWVLDAATNTLVAVEGAKVTPRAFFRNPPVGDAVPTCLAKGPDGALYVGELTAAMNKPGSARIWRVWPNHNPVVWRTGFSNVSGCGFDRQGNFYAVELQTTAFNPGPTGDGRGAVIKVAPNGTRTTLGYGKLFFPQGFAVGSDGGIFVANWSVLPAKAAPGKPSGQVVKITP